MAAVFTILVGMAGGLHAALYGAYKDSPQESFLLRRFLRELVFAAVIASGLAAFRLSQQESLFIVYLSVFALARIVTEFWKLFLRVEPQREYRIPLPMDNRVISVDLRRLIDDIPSGTAGAT
jgi:hypothetical protein